jgi:choline dehydrogenase
LEEPVVSSQSASDIVIVGAGAAGCALARRIAERTDRSVLLLEAGAPADTPEMHDGWRLPTLPDWGFAAEPGGAADPPKLRRGRLLGGTSWLTRFAVRGPAADFHAWGGNGLPGWSYEDVLPAFRRLESDAEFGDRPWHGDSGPIPITRYPTLPRSGIHEAAVAALTATGVPAVDDHNAPDAIGVGPLPMSSRDGRRTTSFDAYLGITDRPANLSVRAEALVASVRIRAGRATGVALADGSDIDAGLVILAAGTYGSPVILMRSGIGPADHLREHGVRVEVDLPGVGANLADHPGVDLDSGWRGEGTVGPLLHSIATFRSSRATSAAPDLMFWLTDPDASDPAFYLDPILLKPLSRGTVRLRSADPVDPPRITLPGLRDEADIERLMEGYERAIEVANRPEVRALAADAAPDLPAGRGALRARVLENAYSVPHVVGTCRMGISPADGDVVDVHGRVHGIGGLHVVDASIIPEAPAGFPHIVTIMLAEHLAARLAD